MHCNKYIQSSSPYIIPRSVILHLSFPHFGHLKSYPISGLFSAVPVPSFFWLKFSVINILLSSVYFSFRLHLEHARYSLLFLFIIFIMLLHFLQNFIGMFCRDKKNI